MKKVKQCEYAPCPYPQILDQVLQRPFERLTMDKHSSLFEVFFGKEEKSLKTLTVGYSLAKLFGAVIYTLL